MEFKNIFYKAILTIAVTASTNAFGMQRVNKLVGHLAQQVPKLTEDNIQKHPEFKEHFIKEIKDNFSKLCSEHLFFYFLRVYSQEAKEFTNLASQNLDKIHFEALGIILKNDPNSLNIIIKAFKDD